MSQLVQIGAALLQALRHERSAAQFNPRLGRRHTDKEESQEQILELMKDWTLDELAVSFLESGFWPQEALILVQEKLGNKVANIVVEGNRRLAALKLLMFAKNGKATSGRWGEMAASAAEDRFRALERIP